MYLISHRGNTHGKIIELENEPEYIDQAIALGFDVEIDIRFLDGKLYLGHDGPQYNISLDWIIERKDHLWIHCKDGLSLQYLYGRDVNFFYHNIDDYTLTSKGYIWAYPTKEIDNCISVLPEIKDTKPKNCLGVCSDYIDKYRKLLNPD
jgi:hypothetical protein